MIAGQKIVVVLPAFNAARTLRKTYEAIPRETGLPHHNTGGSPRGVVDQVILTDDASSDGTLAAARQLDLIVLAHDRNRGYGANQKTCYRHALEIGADVVVMLHPDYQYDPALIPSLAGLVVSGSCDIALASRMTDRAALRGGMPVYKYLGNRLLTAWQNFCLGQRLTEYHPGYRAFSRRVLQDLPLASFSDDFIFDNQILVTALERGYRLGEIPCPARYDRESSSIGLGRSLVYGWQVLLLSWRHRRRAAGRSS